MAENETIIVNNDLRTMQIPSSLVLLGVESDDDVNKIPFQMPKEYCGFDLSEFEVRINYMNANGIGDLYIVDDVEIDGDDPSLMTFTWLVGRNACAYKGNTQFIVCLKKFDNDQNVVQEFNTTVYSLPVLEGLETTEAVVQQNPDIIEYILKLIEEAGIIDLHDYYTKEETNALKLPNPQPLNINGTEYDGSEPVELTIEGGSSTVESAEGQIIHVEDAVPNNALKSMNLYDSLGESIASALVAITNKNLFRLDLIAQQTISKGITFEKSSDGSIHATGTSTGTYAAAQAAIDKNAFVVGETYTISSGKTAGSLYVQLILNYTDGTTDYLVSSKSPYTFTLAKEVASASASVQITASGVTVDEWIFPMIELSDKPSAFTNNVYSQITYNGLIMPVLPDSICNIWSNDDTVANIIIEYSNDQILAKLNELETEVYNIDKPIDDAMDTESENAVKNKVITAELMAKMPNPTGTGTAGQLLTKTANGHEWQDAVVDGALSTTSKNPVQNKVITQVLSGLTDEIAENTSNIETNASNIGANATAISENAADINALSGSMAQIETTPATANHEIGEYIVYESQLYKVIAAIAAGETLVVGTNIEATSTGAEITDLKSDLTNVNDKFLSRTINSGSSTTVTIPKNRPYSIMWQRTGVGSGLEMVAGNTKVSIAGATSGITFESLADSNRLTIPSYYLVVLTPLPTV